MLPLRLILLVLFVILFLFSIVEILLSKNKKKTFYTNLVLSFIIIPILFLHGPLFVFSPLKPGFASVTKDNFTFYYPKTISLDHINQFTLLLDQARHRLSSVFTNSYPITFIIVNNSKDMFLLGGSPTERAGGSSNSEAVYVKDNYWDLGVVTHEMSHQYLQRAANRPSYYFPRWFDEGLATYLGATGQLEKFTYQSELDKAINSDFYEHDLRRWDGLAGIFNWSLKDIRYRPGLIYTQTYFLVKYLVDQYGSDKIVTLITACRTTPDFNTAFQSTYALSVPEFHHKFLNLYHP